MLNRWPYLMLEEVPFLIPDEGEGEHMVRGQARDVDHLTVDHLEHPLPSAGATDIHVLNRTQVKLL